MSECERSIVFVCMCVCVGVGQRIEIKESREGQERRTEEREQSNLKERGNNSLMEGLAEKGGDSQGHHSFTRFLSSISSSSKDTTPEVSDMLRQ